MTRVEPLSLPSMLVEAAERDGRLAWLATLPGTVRELAKRWDLVVGEPFRPGGQTAWVAPAGQGDRGDLVLKVGWRHPEADHEADGLREWDGQGAVRLHAAAEFGQKAAAGRVSIDPGLAREGMALFRTLPATAERNVLLCTDLHAGNVLAAEREPWLVIDPKPYLGDPTYDPLQHLLNCEGRLEADPVGLVRRMDDLLALDHERLRLWLFARCVQESPDRPGLAGVARRIAPR